MRNGTYQLLLKLDRGETIAVGRLGVFYFPSGYYIYTGSAMNGIDARIARHLSKRKKYHWHIDYLLERCSILRYASKESSTKQECYFNTRTLQMPGAWVVVRGFGSSDCRCESHLVYFEQFGADACPVAQQTEPQKLAVEIYSGLCADDGRKPV